MSNFSTSYIRYNKEGKEKNVLINQPCFSTGFGFYNNQHEEGDYIIVLIDKNNYFKSQYWDLKYSEEEVIKYIDIVNKIGFPCEYLGIIERGEGIEYYSIKVKTEDHKTQLALNATLTVIRYLYENYYTDIPSEFFKLLEAEKDIDNMVLFMLSHYSNPKIPSCTTHGLICPRFVNLFTIEEYKQKISETKETRLNDFFSKMVDNKSWNYFHELYKEGKYKQIIKESINKPVLEEEHAE